MSMFSRLLMVILLLAVGTGTAAAETILNGTFTADDDEVIFDITLSSPGTITIETTSYADGGFAPVLSIFGAPNFAPGDPSLLGYNDGPDGGPCGSRATNPTTGACLDALLGYDPDTSSNPLGTLAAGSYLVVLTEQENVPNGPDLDSGFDLQGTGNFTAIPGVNNGPFVDPTNPTITDTGDWTVEFEGVSSAEIAGTPEPATLLPMCAVLGFLGFMRLRRLRRAT